MKIDNKVIEAIEAGDYSTVEGLAVVETRRQLSALKKWADEMVNTIDDAVKAGAQIEGLALSSRRGSLKIVDTAGVIRRLIDLDIEFYEAVSFTQTALTKLDLPIFEGVAKSKRGEALEAWLGGMAMRGEDILTVKEV